MSGATGIVQVDADWPSCWSPMSEMTLQTLHECQQVCLAMAAAVRDEAMAGNPFFRRAYGKELRNLAGLAKRIAELLRDDVDNVHCEVSRCRNRYQCRNSKCECFLHEFDAAAASQNGKATCRVYACSGQIAD